MDVGIYLCMCVCMYDFYVSMYKSVCMYVGVYACMYVAFVSMYVCRQIRCMYVCTYVAHMSVS